MTEESAGRTGLSSEMGVGGEEGVRDARRAEAGARTGVVGIDIVTLCDVQNRVGFATELSWRVRKGRGVVNS